MATRVQSIDVLRGYDMFWITGGAGVFTALAKALPSPVTDFLAQQVEHVDWIGFHHHDLIFPLFLFLAGASWPFSLASRRARGISTGRIALGILRRFAILFVLGATLFRSPHRRHPTRSPPPPPHVPGILQARTLESVDISFSNA